MYAEGLPLTLSQGDIFVQIELIDSASPTAPPRTHSVIVLSHTCEIEKSVNSIVLVCVILPLSDVDPGQKGHIKKNRVFNAMYLEPIGDLPESFIDFRYVFRTNKAYLEYAIGEGLRITSLNEESKLAFATFFYRFLGRKVT